MCIFSPILLFPHRCTDIRTLVNKNPENENLKDLAKALPATVLQSKASYTTSKHLEGFKRWKLWATEHRLPTFPAVSSHVVLYLQHLGQSKGSKAAAVNSISWAHCMVGMPSPTAEPFVQAVLAGLKRSLAKPITKKEPFTVDMVKSVIEDAMKDGSLASIRLATMCAMAFAGFLRYSKVCNIRLCDMELNPSYLKIKIPKSKSDQLRQGDEVVIARSASKYCPVFMLECYMEKAGITFGSDKYLF